MSTRRRRRTIFGCSLLVSLAAIVQWPALPSAFDAAHRDVTAAALLVLTDAGLNDALVAVSGIGDEGAAWLQSGAHYDNCAGAEGRAWIREHRVAAVTAALAYEAGRAPTDRQRAIDNLGYVLHAT